MRSGDDQGLGVEYSAAAVGWRWVWRDRQGVTHYGPSFHVRRGQAMADGRHSVQRQPR